MSTKNEHTTRDASGFSAKGTIKVDVFDRRILLKLAKNEKDIQFIRSMPYCKWNSHHYHWVIPNYPGNLERIQSYFGERIGQYIEHVSETFNLQNPAQSIKKSRNEVLLILTQQKRIRIIFGFNFDLMNFIKKIPYHSWDSKNKWWYPLFRHISNPNKRTS